MTTYLSNGIEKIIEYFRNGKIVLLPSDIGWIIACNANDKIAVQKILNNFKISSAHFVPFSLPALNWLFKYILNVHFIALKLYTIIIRALSWVSHKITNLKNYRVNIRYFCRFYFFIKPFTHYTLIKKLNNPTYSILTVYLIKNNRMNVE